jgi:drug/metabolite transporter (DMT)-like permease
MTEARKGNIFIISEMILWSLFPILATLGFKGITPLVSLFWVNLIATLFFFCLMFVRGRWQELKDKLVWLYTLGIVIFVCVLFYGLYFYALGKTTPANAAIVALFEIVPSYIFFQIIKKEHFDSRHILGIILGIVGALIVLLPKAGTVHSGDFIILLAVFFPPIGNWYQQKIRKIASTETVLFLRHLLSIPFILILIYVFGMSISLKGTTGILGWLLLNGIVVFGISKIFWVEAIHRMSVTKALAISSLNPIFTVLFAWFLMNQTPTIFQLAALPFLIVSVWILTNMSFPKISDKVQV